MERPHVRPRVALRFPHAPEALNGLLQARLDANPKLEGRIRRGGVLVWMAPGLRRWWSPCLDLNVDAEAGGTRLVGWYAAHPRLMGAMAFGSIALTFLGLLSGTWSLVQWQMGEAPRCLLGTGLAVVGLGALFALNRLGQRWAADQMHELAALLADLGAVEVDEAHAFR